MQAVERGENTSKMFAYLTAKAEHKMYMSNLRHIHCEWCGTQYCKCCIYVTFFYGFATETPCYPNRLVEKSAQPTT